MRRQRSGRLLELQLLLAAHALALALSVPILPRDAPWIVALAGSLGLLVAHIFARVHYPEGGRAYIPISLMLSLLSLALFYVSPLVLAPLALLHPYLCFRIYERVARR